MNVVGIKNRNEKVDLTFISIEFFRIKKWWAKDFACSYGCINKCSLGPTRTFQSFTCSYKNMIWLITITNCIVNLPCYGSYLNQRLAQTYKEKKKRQLRKYSMTRSHIQLHTQNCSSILLLKLCILFLYGNFVTKTLYFILVQQFQCDPSCRSYCY